jgi:hypothetical protein
MTSYQDGTRVRDRQISTGAHDATPDSTTVSQRLKAVIDNLPPAGVKLADLRDMFGQDGLMVFTIFLVIPFMVPVSIPGVSTVFGAAILLIGVSRLLGRKLWLPKRFEQRVLPSDKLRVALTKGLVFFNRMERLTRPHRLQRLASDRLACLSLILGAILLMAPFGLIPFSNTLPGIALMFLALGMLQRDGGSILLGHLVNLATIVYFAFLIAAGGGLIYMFFHRAAASP